MNIGHTYYLLQLLSKETQTLLEQQDIYVT